MKVKLSCGQLLYIQEILHVLRLKTNCIHIGETKNVRYNVKFIMDKCIMKEKKTSKVICTSKKNTICIN